MGHPGVGGWCRELHGSLWGGENRRPVGPRRETDLSEAHAVGLLPDLRQPQPLLHLAVPGDGGPGSAGGSPGLCPPTHRPAQPTCGPLASCAAHPGAQAAASLASRVGAPAICRTCARSRPSAHSPPAEARAAGGDSAPGRARHAAHTLGRSLLRAPPATLGLTCALCPALLCTQYPHTAVSLMLETPQPLPRSVRGHRSQPASGPLLLSHQTPTGLFLQGRPTLAPAAPHLP